ncbi:MAG: hypothetical protein ABDH66_06870 [Bacteroidia bacterium]
MSWVWLQIALFGGWGGHTSRNDLVAPDEVWHRFYGMGVIGVRFLPERRIQPTLSVELGSFISQSRQQGLFSQTHWNSVGIGLRARFLKKVVSPFLEGQAFRLVARCRDAEGKVMLNMPSSFSANGLGWGAGLSWRISPYGEVALAYVRRRPQTTQLEGVSGPAKDRIEGLIGQLSLYISPGTFNRARFQ